MKLFLKLVLFLQLMLLFQCKSSSNMDIENTHYSNDNINKYSGNSGFFIDKRDGNKYKWVKIDGQIWMAENLRYRTDTGSVAYKYSKRYIGRFGYLYNGKTAQIVCPKGWHLPTKQEYEGLCKFLGNNIHDVFDALNNNDNIGFNSINAGSYNANTDKYRKSYFFRLEEYWTATICYTDSLGANDYNSFIINYFRKIALVGEYGRNGVYYYYPIRCIKND